MTRRIDRKKGLAILNIAKYYMPIGIGFRELQRLTSFGNGTIIKWRKLLQESNLVLKDSRGKIYLNENTNNNFEKDLVIRKYGNTSQSNVLRGKRSIRKKNKRDSFKQRRDNAYCLIATVAAMGNSSWKRTTAHGYGLVSMTDLQTGMDISFISSPLPGIGISDFYKYDKKGIQSMFDTRTFVDYNERYSYLNPSDEEAQQYIRELYENEPPVLKEIEIDDHEFLCFLDDPNQKTSIRLEKENLRVYDQNTIKLTLNTDNDDGGLPIIHEINCDFNYPTSLILINVNNIKARKYLGLDALYGESNNFSESIWAERRYIIADPLLREFIQICNLTYEVVYKNMEILYCHNLLSKDLRREYLKWYHNIYGVARRGAEILNLDRISITRIKKNVKMLSKLDNTEERNRIINEPDYVCRCKLWGPYEKVSIPWADKVFTLNDLDDIKIKLKALDKESKQIIPILHNHIDKYHNQIESQKFKDFGQKYGILIRPLLDISYPNFLTKLSRTVTRPVSLVMSLSNY